MSPWHNHTADEINSDSCLIKLGKYHHATAIKIGSQDRQVSEDAKAGELKELVYDATTQVLRDNHSTLSKDPKAMNEVIRVTQEMPGIRQQWDWISESCLILGSIAEALNGKRAYASARRRPS
ncbi:hypothetical protein G6011_06143 [Alternaria panax]|uniref:Uncharacterized protein n=1 Tax=Alternaria panax TaxID=48097 RepID=A0AAD4FH48_9PLEO|nr:hypothetical protein G6011_06143 [Alternaria panax]